jgi:flagellar L-ring protein FlgH
VEVLPNGILRIEGVRNVQLEKDVMTLVFSGTVRQEDIAPDNCVYSVQIADQRLEATGVGPIAEKQRPGLLTRLLSWLW